MDDLQSKVRTHLRAAVAALDALDDLCTAENGLTAQGITAENAIDELIDNFPDDIRGRCQGCATIMFCGDKGHVCHDGDPVLCAECAFTYADVKEQYDTGEHGGDAEDRAAFMRLYDDHIAGGGRSGDKLLHTL